MVKTKFEDVDHYISTFPVGIQSGLESIRKSIRAAVPLATECIHYQLPAFNQNGWIFYFSAYSSHYAISCPPPFTVFDHFADELAPYTVKKSSVQFPMENPLPLDLIGKMASFRAEELLQYQSNKKK